MRSFDGWSLRRELVLLGTSLPHTGRAGGAAQPALSRFKGSRNWRGSSKGLKARLVSPCPAAPSPAPPQMAEDVIRLPQVSGKMQGLSVRLLLNAISKCQSCV